jgi:endonuclease YncB( thermonuclease family)
LRVVAVDGDGTLVVVLRCDGRNPAVTLLRAGLVRSRGTGARRYRQAEAAAQAERLGLWHRSESGTPRSQKLPTPLPAVAFPWWQG